MKGAKVSRTENHSHSRRRRIRYNPQLCY